MTPKTIEQASPDVRDDPDEMVSAIEQWFRENPPPALASLQAQIAALQAELAEARGKALEEAAQEADKWFPADTASKYPKGGIAAAIRNLKAK